MKCPHCLVAFSVVWNNIDLAKSTPKDCGPWTIGTCVCPECQHLIIQLLKPEMTDEGTLNRVVEEAVYPRSGARPVPRDVPPALSRDFTEACLVLFDSAKASAALSRRCLQNLLREKAGVKRRDLNDEIQEVLNSGTLPPYLAGAIDAVRQVGNFATHPMKSSSTGEIVDVEPGEAEWNLDTLEALFEFYFVQPATLQEKRELLNTKLKALGKPLLK